MNNVVNDEDSLLALSGIQHIAFCERQWALIHIEQQWAENLRTVEGRHLHERADNPFIMEKRGEFLTARAVPIVSYELGLYGVADVVEFRKVDPTDSNDGTSIPGQDGLWHPYPIEYKRGKPKKDDRDEVQLCAQAICLEEMLQVHITSGAFFYGTTKRRLEIKFSTELRKRVGELAGRMHTLFSKGTTPGAISNSHCKSCSLVDICMPKLNSKAEAVSRYIRKHLDEIEAHDD